VPFASDPICAVVAAPSVNALLRDLRAAARLSSTCELRLDWLRSTREIERVLASLPSTLAKVRADAHRAPGKLCIIATLRRRDAGGRFTGSRSAQTKFLLAAAAAGCNWCDIELPSAQRLSAAQRSTLRRAGARILVSFHDFRRTPRDLSAILARLDRCRGDAIKIAAQCNSLSDAARVLATTRGRTDVVAVPMGDAGLPGRILALRLGSALAYASLNHSTAPGQLSVREMRETYHTDEPNRRTRIFAIIGAPVSHSLSPTIHNAGYRAARKNSFFLPIRVKNLRDFLRAAPSFAISGFAVTIPHKETIVRHLAKCDALSSRIGAMNTVAIQKDGRLFGYNTDYIGVLRSITPHLRPRGSRILILGAGGAARAAAFALTDAGASVSICSRRPHRARALARATGAQAISRSALKRTSFDLIVNATPIGMSARDHSPLTASELNSKLVMDMVYNPIDTALLKLAKSRGIKTISGLEMFIAQAAAQWKIWWGSSAPVKVMRSAAVKALRELRKNAPGNAARKDAARRSARSH
jgi:3-dehydroquinate dehydratase / shikimate dehydrogenase